MTWRAAVLQPREDAEDEAVRDLRRSLKTSVDGLRRSSSASFGPELRPDDEILCPDVGRVRDVAQPGGFRRHHVIQRSGTPDGAGPYARSTLTQLLVPKVCFPSLPADLDGDEAPEADAAGDATNTATWIVLCKCFFGSALLVVPGGFLEAGLLGGPLCLVAVFAMEVMGMLHLIRCREVKGPGYRYEDIGGVLGKWGTAFITAMIATTQVGFCCIWYVSMTENVSMLLPQWGATPRLWIWAIPLIPLVWVRHLKYFAPTFLFALVLCTITLVYLTYFAARKIYDDGIQSVPMFNTSNFNSFLWLGSCSYVYEGINLVLPIYESAMDKATVPRLVVGSTLLVTALYAGLGCLFYLAFGGDTKDMATLNLPRGSFWGVALPSAFALVGLFTAPLNVFVICQMYERRLSWSPRPTVRKWQKNGVRALLCLMMFSLTWLGGEKLQNFLALVGGLGCSTLALILPPMLHTIICKPGVCMRMINAFVSLIGICVLVLSTYQAIVSWK